MTAENRNERVKVEIEKLRSADHSLAGLFNVGGDGLGKLRLGVVLLLPRQQRLAHFFLQILYKSVSCVVLCCVVS